MILLWLLSITAIGINRQREINRFARIYNWIDMLWLSFLGLIILMINVSAGSIKESIHFGDITFSYTLTRPAELMYLIIALGIIILTIVSMLYQESILKHRPNFLKTILIILLLFFPFIGVWVINKKIKDYA